MKKLLIVLTLLFAWMAQATMVKPMSVEDLTAAASTVVEGQATRSWTSWNAQHTRIYTFTQVRVSQVLKGSPAESVIVKQVGGSAGGYTQHVSGVHAILPGQNVLLFLRPGPEADGTLTVVGLMQGQFRMEHDAVTGHTVVSNGILGAEPLPSDGSVKPYRGSRLTLSQMEARIRRAVRRE